MGALVWTAGRPRRSVLRHYNSKNGKKERGHGPAKLPSFHRASRVNMPRPYQDLGSLGMGAGRGVEAEDAEVACGLADFGKGGFELGGGVGFDV